MARAKSPSVAEEVQKVYAMKNTPELPKVSTPIAQPVKKDLPIIKKSAPIEQIAPKTQKMNKLERPMILKLEEKTP